MLVTAAPLNPVNASPVAADEPTTAPAPAPAPPAVDLRASFTDIAAKLTASDATLAEMVTKRNTVGLGWAPHLSAIAGQLQAARDRFMDARPEATELAARLGVDVLRIAEASGSLSIMARQRATLSEGWSTFLDGAIANAAAAAALLEPVADPAPAPTPTPTPAPATPSHPAPVVA